MSNNRFYTLIILFFLGIHLLNAGSAEKSKTEINHVFQLQNPDYKVSPKTGMTREHWKQAAEYMLKGAFGYIHTLDDPMKFPKMHEVTYPKTESQVPTEKLEGLCRTLFIAAPLLKENPNLILNNIKVADYYRHQILNLIDSTHPSYIKHRSKNGGPSQNLVEYGALCISLYTAPEVLWDPLPQDKKDALAASMLSYGDGPTVDSNWKFFNIFILSFFDQQGYKVNKKLLVEYLQKSLKHYRGEGWYNDSPAFDYYSMWAFQMYGILWADFYGNINYPEIASQFTRNFADLKDNYPYLFARDGKMVMWGRSISYRYASVTPFPLMGLENDPKTNWGWMRRIASSTLLQFLQHPDFMVDGVPSLGFYGPFEPAVQMYSCRGSVYWGGKVFLGLVVPESHPFWQTKENEGPWETKFKKNKVYNKFQPGSEILITNYSNIGASEVRAWCHADKASDWQKFRSSENYNRLSYSSAFLWQADGKNGEVAMNYVFKNKKGEWEPLRLYTFKSFKNGIYSRDVVLETMKDVKLKLNEKMLPNGIDRKDTLFSAEDINFRLGHYALPELNRPIKKSMKKIGKFDAYSIDNGQYKLTMIVKSKDVKLAFVDAENLHPESKKSTVINAVGILKGGQPMVLETSMLWEKSR